MATFLQDLLHASLHVAFRRLWRGPRAPTWGLRLEAAMAAAHRARAREEGAERVDWVARRRPVLGRRPRLAPSVPRRQDRTLPGTWFLPPGSEEGPFALFLHGGGFTSGHVDDAADTVARLAVASGRKVLYLAYPLAPEHPFPAAIDAVADAFRTLVDRRIPPADIALVGASAGGGLAVSATLALRGAGDPLPGAIVAWSPWADLTLSAPSIARARETDYCSALMLRRQAEAWLAGADPRDPLASVLFADLRGLPRLLIQAGGAEALLDDATELASAARDAGVDVTLEVWPDLPHAFQFLGLLDRRATDAVERAARWLGGRPGGRPDDRPDDRPYGRPGAQP